MPFVSRCLTIALCLAALFCSSCAPAAEIDKDVRVLFVGNSLTYVGNLPAVLAALATSNGKRISTDMLVSGGATLADRVNDSSVKKLLAARRFDFVILQERGGDVLCVSDVGTGKSCDSYNAHIELGRIVRSHHAKPVVLGTYQSLEPVSRAVEANEAVLAKRIGAVHVRVSERFRFARAQYPTMNWYAADGSHPGPDLVLFEAVRLYSAIYDASPAAHELRIAKPYDTHAYFTGSLAASAQATMAPVATYTYDAHRVAKISAIALADPLREAAY